MIKVLRYSVDGFLPQHQTYHLKHINYLFRSFNLGDFPESAREEMKKLREKQCNFYSQHLQDFQDGIWCFVLGYKDNQSLNHLKHKVPAWTAELPDDTICYSVNWDIQFKLSDDKAKIFGVYIPKRELINIKNIQRYRLNK